MSTYSRNWYYSKKSTQSLVSKRIPEELKELESAYIDAMARKKEAEEELMDLRNQILEIMKENERKHIRTEKMNISVIASFEGRKINSKDLKQLEPAIYEEFSTPYVMPEHLQITIKR